MKVSHLTTTTAFVGAAAAAPVAQDAQNGVVAADPVSELRMRNTQDSSSPSISTSAEVATIQGHDDQHAQEVERIKASALILRFVADAQQKMKDEAEKAGEGDQIEPLLQVAADIQKHLQGEVDKAEKKGLVSKKEIEKAVLQKRSPMWWMFAQLFFWRFCTCAVM